MKKTLLVLALAAVCGAAGADTLKKIKDSGAVTMGVRESSGAPVLISIGFPGGRTLRARIWIARVGRVDLLLLDSDIEENDPIDREVTDRLYGGAGSDTADDSEMP